MVFFYPKLNRFEFFQTELTWRLACLPSFCELVFSGAYFEQAFANI